MKEIKLKSGATLQVGVATFREAKNLFDAISKKVKSEKLDPESEFDINFVKGLGFGLVSDAEVEAAIWPILNRSLYNKEKITESLFDENVNARKDFLEVCYEVGKEAVFPFVENLYAQLLPVLAKAGLFQK